MKLIVNPHKIELVQEEAVNEKEINISKCQFEFNEEITDDFVKEAYFTLNGETYKKIIVNNECTFPQEVLVKEGTIELGVVATYTDIISQEVTRYNPTPVYFKTDLGSLKEAQNSEEITPSEMEQYEQALNDGLNTLNNAVDDLQDKVDSGYFKGEKGDKGDTGEQGVQGERGLQGEQGIQGEKGEKGDKGDKGDTGEKGQDGTNGKDGRDGYVQYTAGKNISINGNVINAEVPEIDLSNYYDKDEVNGITGLLNNLDTKDKSNLVNAINELLNSSTGIIDISDADTISTATYGPGIYYSQRQGSLRIYARKDLTGPYADVFTSTGAYIFTFNSGYISWLTYLIAIDRDYLYYFDSNSSIAKKVSLYNLMDRVLFTNNTTAYTPTANYHPATKKYVDDSIATIPSSSYTAGEGINISNDEISSTMPIYLITNNTLQNPFIIENAKTGIYVFGNVSAVYLKGYEEATNFSSISLCNGFIILTNTTIDRTQTTWQQIGYVWGTQTDSTYNNVLHYSGTLVTRALDGKVQFGQSTGITSVPTQGNCNIFGVKTFKALPETTIVPTTDNQFTNKKYVDDAIASVAGGSDVSIYNFDIVGQNINDNQSLNATNKTALQELLNTLYTNGVNMFSLLVSGTNGMIMSDKEVKYQLLISPNRNTIELQNKPTILYFGGYIQPGWISGNVLAYLKMTISLTWSNDVCTVTSAEYSWTQTGFADANEVLTKTNSTYYVPSSSFNPATKKYVDDKYKAYTGYDATKTQVLKNINGTLTWVDE